MWMHLRPLGRLPPHTPMAQVFLEKELLNQFPLEGTVLKKKKKVIAGTAMALELLLRGW